MNKQRVSFAQPDSHIEMITVMGESGKPFRLILQAPRGGYFGTVSLSAAEMVNLRNAIDTVLATQAQGDS